MLEVYLLILLTVTNDFFVLIKNFINKNPFIKACLIVSGAAIIFLLGTNVGNILHTLTK